MRNTNLPLVLLCAITLLVGTIVGSALRSAMHAGMPLQAGEPYWMASNAGP
jgi:hypothetical protein